MSRRSNASLIEEVEKWSESYEFTFQFWGKGQYNVFINKHDVELASFGGENSIRDILIKALNFVRRINMKPEIK